MWVDPAVNIYFIVWRPEVELAELGHSRLFCWGFFFLGGLKFFCCSRPVLPTLGLAVKR